MGLKDQIKMVEFISLKEVEFTHPVSEKKIVISKDSFDRIMVCFSPINQYSLFFNNKL